MENQKYPKRIFVPTMDELYQMQEMNGNVYKYLMIKAIESLVYSEYNYPSEGILLPTTSYFKQGEIARAICTMYPEEMSSSIHMSVDIELCNRLISQSREPRTCGLDYLKHFSKSILNNELLKNIIVLLEQELSINPKYRFEYVDLGYRSYDFSPRLYAIIDKILNRDITTNDMVCLLKEQRDAITKALVKIEPSYALSLPEDCFNLSSGNRANQLQQGINCYGDRYGITPTVGTEYIGQDILTNPNKDVKRLIRCINSRKKKTTFEFK